MKTIVNILMLLFVFGCLKPLDGKAQRFWICEVPQENLWEVAPCAGIAVYQGDLVPSIMGSFKDAAPMGGLIASYYFKKGIGMRTTLVSGGLKGNDAQWAHPEWRRHRNFSFKSIYAEWSAAVTYDVGAVMRDRHYNFKWGFVIVAGGGIVYTNPQRSVSELDIGAFSPDDPALSGLEADMSRSSKAWTGLAILGGDIKYYLNKKTAIYAEAMLHHGFSDRLDGFEAAVSGSRPDGYITYSAGCSFRLK